MEIFWFKIVILGSLFILSLSKVKTLLVDFRKFILPLVALLTFSLLFYFTREQFFYWYGGEVTKALVPPYSPSGILYFLNFTFFRFWAEFVISLVWALFFLAAALFANRKFGGRFFYEEEVYLAASSIFLTGYPSLIYYLSIYFTAFLLAQLFFQGRDLNFRVSSYYLWLPLAIVVVVISYYFSRNFSLFRLLKV